MEVARTTSCFLLGFQAGALHASLERSTPGKVFRADPASQLVLCCRQLRKTTPACTWVLFISHAARPLRVTVPSGDT
jgi:hypothetical protein